MFFFFPLVVSVMFLPVVTLFNAVNSWGLVICVFSLSQIILRDINMLNVLSC